MRPGDSIRLITLKGKQMANRKVVVEVHGHKRVRYKGELVVEAPEDIEDEDILDAVLMHQDFLSIGWQEDEEGRDRITRDAEDFGPYVVRTGEPDQKTDITLKLKRTSTLKAFYGA